MTLNEINQSFLSSVPQVFWTANNMDAYDQVTQETYGYGSGAINTTITHGTQNPEPEDRITGITSSNSSGTLQNLSYTWYKLGNLNYRSNSTTANGNQSEQFQYDLLNRLTSAQVTNSNGVQPALSYAYDALGDITCKSDVVGYACSNPTGYTYGGTAGPHAVTSIVGSQGGTYQYDTDGNMTHRVNTAIQWNSDNLPTCIDAGGGSCTGSNWSTFKYAPDKHRYYQSAMIGGVAETTVYSGAFEAWTKAGTTTYRYHLMADDREVAEVNFTNSGSSSVETISYVLTDHLGSTDVVQTRDINNNLISTNHMSFGAWGNRRLAGTWLPPVGATETQADHGADRYGFTHQEMLDNVALIHMNGRVYDPNIGRFLSVDPVFEFPTNTQSLNPYSYVLNNPLSLTDPTGYAAAPYPTGTSCPADNHMSAGDTAHISYTPTGSHIAVTATATVRADGSVAVTTNAGNHSQVANNLKNAAVAMFGGDSGAKNSQGTASTDQLANDNNKGSPSTTSQGQAKAVPTNPNDSTGSQTARQPMSLSSNGLDFIKGYEKLRLKEYKDQSGNETIGYGHKILPGEDFSKGITNVQALALLKTDAQSAVGDVNAALTVSVSQNQFDSLVSLRFNAGRVSVLPGNEMMRAVNSGSVKQANFTAYDKITIKSGKLVFSQGLFNRRVAEYQMYSGGGQ